MQHARPILWDVYEEHLDEAAFLWAQWERALCASNYTLREVAEGPEERLLAHLDGLVLGGRAVAERLLRPALGDDDGGRVSAAAWALLQAEDADHFDAVWEALTATEERAQRGALSRALELCHRSDLPHLLLARLPGASPEVAACVIDGLVARGRPELSRLSLQGFSAEAHPELLAAVLRALQHLPDPSFQGLIERGLASEQTETLDAALEAGALLQVPSTRAACRRVVAERGPNRRLALGILGLGDAPEDRARLLEWAAVPELAGDALWALAFCGRVDVAELLLGRLDEPELAPIAAESFSSITGLLVEGPLVRPGESARLDEPFDDDGPVPEVKPEDDLPMPRADAMRGWWRSSRAQFDPNARYAWGQAWSASALQGAMSRGPTWRRQVLRLGLGKEAAARTHLRQWARRQLA